MISYHIMVYYLVLYMVFRYIYIYIWVQSCYEPLQCFRTCHRIHRFCARFTEVVHVCKKLCTFHKRPNNLTFVFNCCGMDRSRWGLLTRLSRYTRIHRNHQRTQSRNSVAIHYLSPHVRIFFVLKNHQKTRQLLGDKQWVHPRHFAVKRGDVEMAKSRSQIQR
jgi:hypothetical protein